jgi:competence protein ComEA
VDEGPELRRPAPPVSWRERIDAIADATGVTPLRLALGAAVTAIAVVGALWLLRPPPEPVEVSLPFASTTDPAVASSTTSTAPETLLVHVAGAVVAPGVHEVADGARVIDAIDAAGGLAPMADVARINLAARVTDGERVYVPAVGEDPPPALVGGGAAAGGGAGGTPGPVDLNAADAATLDSLPGVGPSTAAAIIEHRERIGGFTSVEQLLDVRGIGEAKLEQLRSLVTV